MRYQIAQREDAELLIELYNAAFYDDFIRYGECPAYGRTKKRMEASIDKYPKLICYSEDVPIGVISYENKGDGEYYLGCLCIIPEYQGRGFGTEAFKYLQDICSDWKRITLQTPADKEENIRFYTEKCGCVLGEKEYDENVEVVKLVLQRIF